MIKCLISKLFDSTLKNRPRIFLKSLEIQHIEKIFKKVFEYTSNIHIYDRYITNNFIEKMMRVNVM